MLFSKNRPNQTGRYFVRHSLGLRCSSTVAVAKALIPHALIVWTPPQNPRTINAWGMVAWKVQHVVDVEADGDAGHAGDCVANCTCSVSAAVMVHHFARLSLWKPICR